MNCPHVHMTGNYKISKVEGKFFACITAECVQCTTEFAMSNNIERSIDERQLLVEIKPAAGLVMDVSRANH